MTYNFPDHYRGDTFDGVQFTVFVNAAPLDLTNATIKMSLKQSKTAVAVKTLGLQTGLTILDATNGVFKVDEQLIDVPAATYYYDIQFTLDSGAIKTYIMGTWKILKDVT